MDNKSPSELLESIKFRSLEESYLKALERSDYSTDNEPICIGTISDFGEAQIQNLSKGERIFVAFERVYTIICGQVVHSIALNAISTALFLSAKISFPSFNVHTYHSRRIRVTNINEGGATFWKVPDGGIVFVNELHNCRRHSFVVVEVGYQNEGMDMLMREAEVFLNQKTLVQYVVLMNIVSVNHRPQSIRIVVCRRIPRKELLASQKKWEKVKPEDCKVKILVRRMMELTLSAINFEENRHQYDVHVTYNRTFLREQVEDALFELDFELAAIGIPL